MRELKVSEVAVVSGAGHIADISTDIGKKIGEALGYGRFGKDIGNTIGTWLESVPGMNHVNTVIGWILNKKSAV